jgi:hypothetical protein
MTVIINRYISDVEIEAAATRLLQRYGQQRHPILVPPVPIEEIIEHTIDMPLIWDAIPDREDMPVLAKLEVRGQPHPEIAIIMNEDKQVFFAQHEGVEQFSQAHELGHYVLHIDHAKLHTLLLQDAAEQSAVLCRGDVGEQRDRKEWQAERFAAYLLMPQDLIRKACTGMDLCRWSNLYQLKEQFHVTITALTRRLTELRFIIVTGDRTILPYQVKIATQPHSLWE